MKTGKQIDPEGSLDRTLREWRIDDPLPPRFQERVWRRIARQEAPAVGGRWAKLSIWIGQWMSRPSLAASYVAVLLLGGLATGYWQARADNARVSGELRARYVQMMDPYRTLHR